jgi:hypothetical protein
MGTALIAIALFLLSHLGVHTPFWKTAIYMAVLGTGLGQTMQPLLLAAQNSVPYSELGVATATGTFARSIGGSIGVAVMGTIFNNRLATNLPKQIKAIPRAQLTPPIQHALAQLHGADVTANPAAVKGLPLVARNALHLAFSDSLHVVFLAAVPFAILGFLLSLLLREVPLRTATGAAAKAAEAAQAAAAGDTAPRAGEPVADTASGLPVADTASGLPESEELGAALGMTPAS